MPSPTDPLRSLTDGSFRFQMALRPGEGPPFFAPTPHHGEVMAERRALLTPQPNAYAAALPDTAPVLRATASLVQQWLAEAGTADPTLPPGPESDTPVDLARWCARAGSTWEPDWVVLSPDTESGSALLAGAVCFPSGWALLDKLGRPLHDVHAPVPGLNPALGRQITVFLDRLKPGAVWLRDNWGLSADSALNHHPSVPLRRLDSQAQLTATWLRYEEQLLCRLPDNSGILFAIRVGRVRLSEILPFPEVTRRLTTALRTMPEDVAAYKGIAVARASLLQQLTNILQ